jgi:hypothetical protein
MKLFTQAQPNQDSLWISSNASEETMMRMLKQDLLPWGHASGRQLWVTCEAWPCYSGPNGHIEPAGDRNEILGASAGMLITVVNSSPTPCFVLLHLKLSGFTKDKSFFPYPNTTQPHKERISNFRTLRAKPSNRSAVLNP